MCVDGNTTCPTPRTLRLDSCNVNDILGHAALDRRSAEMRSSVRSKRSHRRRRRPRPSSDRSVRCPTDTCDRASAARRASPLRGGDRARPLLVAVAVEPPHRPGRRRPRRSALAADRRSATVVAADDSCHDLAVVDTHDPATNRSGVAVTVTAPDAVAPGLIVAVAAGLSLLASATPSFTTTVTNVCAITSMSVTPASPTASANRGCRRDAERIRVRRRRSPLRPRPDPRPADAERGLFVDRLRPPTRPRSPRPAIYRRLVAPGSTRPSRSACSTPRAIWPGGHAVVTKNWGNLFYSWTRKYGATRTPRERPRTRTSRPAGERAGADGPVHRYWKAAIGPSARRRRWLGPARAARDTCATSTTSSAR